MMKIRERLFNPHTPHLLGISTDRLNTAYLLARIRFGGAVPFRPNGLVLLSGGSWGLRFPPLARGDKRPGRMVVTERLQTANGQNSASLGASLAFSTDPL